MRYQVQEFNTGKQYLIANKSTEWSELNNILTSTRYNVQYCGQENRTEELIFSPSMTNEVLKQELTRMGWTSGINLENSGYSDGKSIDFYKNGVVLEIQFAHYGLLEADIARMEKLYTNQCFLRDRPPIECGIALVVAQEMPTSNSVAHFKQATQRAAPNLAQNIPLVIIGLDPPNSGETVILHEIRPRSRTSTSQTNIQWP